VGALGFPPSGGLRLAHGARLCACPAPGAACLLAIAALGRAAKHGGLILGVLLVLVGGAALLGQAVPTFNTDVVWPLALIVVGALLLVGAFRR
jgi:hypothetical protein